jgi:hypothetical protein
LFENTQPLFFNHHQPKWQNFGTKNQKKKKGYEGCWCKSFLFVFRVARAKFVIVVVGGGFLKNKSYHTF